MTATSCTRRVRGEDQHPQPSTNIPLIIAIYTATLFTVSNSDQAVLTSIAGQCVCPGYNFQLICTAVGLGADATVWTINTTGADSCDDILLRHSSFSDPGGESLKKSCRGRSIVGRSLSVDGNCYTSILDVTVGANLNGIIIGCEYDDGATFVRIGSYRVVLTTESFPPPNDVNLINIGSGELTFSWTNVAPNCSAVSYRIFASGCGMCPVSTNLTTVVCTDVRLTGGNRSCVFRVQTTTCADIHSNSSNPFTTVLQAANLPVVEVLPRYSQDTTLLVSLTVDIREAEPVSISGNDVTADSYIVNYGIANSDCGSEMIESGGSSCSEGVCRTDFNVMTSPCAISVRMSEPEAIVVNVSATSVLGIGPPSQVRMDSSSRNFVRVMADLNGSVACHFQNQQDISEKTCNISYGQCGSQQLNQTLQGNSSLEQPNLVRFQLDLPDSSSYSICYIVTASDGNYTVLVEGSISTTRGTSQPVPVPSSPLGAGAIVGIVLCLIAVTVAVVLATLALVYCILRGSVKGKFTSRQSVSEEEKELDDKGNQQAVVSFADDSPPENDTLPDAHRVPPEKSNLLEDAHRGLPGKGNLSEDACRGLQYKPTGVDIPDVENDKDSQSADVAVKTPVESQLQDSLHSEHKLDESLNTTASSQGKQTIEELLKGKHKGQVPIKLQRHANEKDMKAVNKKFWIPQTMTIAQLGAKFRNVLTLAIEQTLYLIVNDKTMIGSQSLEEVYDSYKNTDGWLYIKYSSREVRQEARFIPNPVFNKN